MLKVTSFYFKLLLLFLTVSFLVFRNVSQMMPHPTKSLHIHYSCSPYDGHSYFEISASHWLFATSLWRHPFPTIRHDKYCHRRCKNPKGRYLNVPTASTCKLLYLPKLLCSSLSTLASMFTARPVSCSLFLPKGLCSRQ